MTKFVLSRSRLEKVFSDNSLWSLLLANLLTIILALWQDWNLMMLMSVYWAQSVIIGGFSFWRMRGLKKFSTDGLKMNGSYVKPTDKTRRSVSRFFLMHYGFFHLIYLIFLLPKAVNAASSLGVQVMVVVFFLNHLYSFFHNRKKDESCVPNIGTLMFLPYARIIPMHLTIILGAAIGSAGLVFFLILKTVADMIMHVVEHQRCKEKLVDLEIAG
jgi:hypothetical protein